MKSDCRVHTFFFCLVALCFWAAPATGSDMQNRDLPVPLRRVLHQAQIRMEQGLYEKAVDALQKYQASNRPGAGDHRIDFFIGNVLYQAGNLQEAAGHYERAVEKMPGFSDAWLNLAQCRYGLSRHIKAGDAFIQAYKTAPAKDPERLYYCAASYLSGGDAVKAIGLLEKLLQDHAAEVRTAWQEALVHALLSAGRPRNALPLMEALVNRFSGNKQALWQENLLHQYLTLDMSGKALALAERLVKTLPLEAKWWKALAHVHLSAGRRREALTALTAAGFLSPPTKAEKRLLADLCLMLGIPRKSIDLYRSLYQESGASPAVERIVQACILSHQPEQALKWVEIGLAKDPTAGLLTLKADLLFELRRFGKAAAAFERLTKQNDADTGRAWLMLGYASLHVEDFLRARTAFQEASRFPEHHEAAVSQLSRISSEE